jgi:hypothetical protein
MAIASPRLDEGSYSLKVIFLFQDRASGFYFPAESILTTLSFWVSRGDQSFCSTGRSETALPEPIPEET